MIAQLSERQMEETVMASDIRGELIDETTRELIAVQKNKSDGFDDISIMNNKGGSEIMPKGEDAVED